MSGANDSANTRSHAAPDCPASLSVAGIVGVAASSAAGQFGD